MFLDHLNIKGNKTTLDIIIAMKAVFILELQIRNEMINDAIPSATFNA